MSYKNETRANKAQEVVDFFKKEFSDQTANSITGGKVYREGNMPIINEKEGTTKISFLTSVTTDAIFERFQEWILGSKVCALNFASYRNPGGGFMRGSMAQEEALCHDSNLYNILSHGKFMKEYLYNREHQNNGLYEDFVIYTPDVVFLTKDRLIDTRCDIITCPAPNWREARSNGISNEKNHSALKSRIESVFKVAKDNGVDILILGAFGCGVFQQDCDEVASIFKEMLDQYHFKEVVIAIPEEERVNVFKKHLL